jgi:hypothetical protein
MVHTDASTYIALADASTNWQHQSAQCLSGRDLSGYDFLRATKDKFVLVSIDPTSEARLDDVGFQ